MPVHRQGADRPDREDPRLAEQHEAAGLLHRIAYAADDMGLKAAAYSVANVADALDSPITASAEVIRAQLAHLMPPGKRGRVRLVLAGKRGARVYLAAADVIKRLLGAMAPGAAAKRLDDLVAAYEISSQREVR